MGHQLWIADALRASGVPVVEVPGWQTRGSASFNPRGGVCHHDAFRSTVSAKQAVALMVNGRSDLPGPLCQVWLDDDRDDTNTLGDPVAYVVAAGRANHAGPGGWNGLSGNSQVWGIEARNAGTGEVWSEAMLTAYQKVAAALARGAGHGSSMICGHKEWAPRRKIDPAGVDMGAFRSVVKGLLAGVTAPLPPPLVENIAVDQGANLALLTAQAYDRAGGSDQWPVLRVGSSGEWVRMFQGSYVWITQDTGLVIDGVYGAKSAEAASNLQRLGGATVDGICGPHTWRIVRMLIHVITTEGRR